MAEIRHSFFVQTQPPDVAAALMDVGHIRNWWTREASITDGVGQFGWSGHGWGVTLEMTAPLPDRSVVWRCTRSNMQNTDAWEGTLISFALTPEDGGTRVDFSQTGYRQSDCFDACDQGWAYFIGTSLKQYLETGKGVPYPEMQDTAEGAKR